MSADAHFRLCPLLGSRKSAAARCASKEEREGRRKSNLKCSWQRGKISLFHALITEGCPRARAANSPSACSRANTGNCAQNKMFNRDVQGPGGSTGCVHRFSAVLGRRGLKNPQNDRKNQMIFSNNKK